MSPKRRLQLTIEASRAALHSSLTRTSRTGQIAEIDALKRCVDRRAIIGRVLDANHPLSRQWVGRPLHGQNPVHYLPDD